MRMMSGSAPSMISIYADTRMAKDLEVLRESITPEPNVTGEKYVFDVPKPNLMYGYAIEWMFSDLENSTQAK